MPTPSKFNWTTSKRPAVMTVTFRANADPTVWIPFRSNDTTNNLVISWGDGSYSLHHAGYPPTGTIVTATHTYQNASNGTSYTIKIYGENSHTYDFYWNALILTNSASLNRDVTLTTWGSFPIHMTGSDVNELVTYKISDYVGIIKALALTNTPIIKGGFHRLPHYNNGAEDPFIEDYQLILKINDWDVSKATSLAKIFRDCGSFNETLNRWKVTNRVTDISYMFQNAYWFNQPIDHWDVSGVKYILNTFTNTVRFNQTLGNWNLASLTGKTIDLSTTAMSQFNNSQTLVGWASRAAVNPANTVKLNINGLDASGLSAKATLESYGWTVIL